MGLTASHPGEHLAEELEALDMSAAERPPSRASVRSRTAVVTLDGGESGAPRHHWFESGLGGAGALAFGFDSLAGSAT